VNSFERKKATSTSAEEEENKLQKEEVPGLKKNV